MPLLLLNHACWGQVYNEFYDVDASKRVETSINEILLSRSLPTPFVGAVKFDWRGRDTGTGESMFDDSFVAQLTFLDATNFRGSMF
jgi:hypothetical protein